MSRMGPSSLGTYGAYQTLQGQCVCRQETSGSSKQLTVMLYFKWGSKPKHCKLVRGWVLFTEAYGGCELNCSVELIAHQICPNYRGYSIGILYTYIFWNKTQNKQGH